MTRLLLAMIASFTALAGAAPASAQSLQSEVLNAHNALRARHGVPALNWSSSLAGTAQAWAERCVFEHSSNGLGENLAMGTSGSYPPASFVEDWYSEIGAYDFASGTGDGTGHFTQVVWKSTTQIGCGLAQCGGDDLLVCNYSPPGNYAGQYVENVPPPN